MGTFVSSTGSALNAAQPINQKTWTGKVVDKASAFATSREMVTLLGITTLVGLITQRTLTGLAITSATGAATSLILWDHYPKVKKLALLTGSIFTAYMTKKGVDQALDTANRSTETTRRVMTTASHAACAAQNVLNATQPLRKEPENTSETESKVTALKSIALNYGPLALKTAETQGEGALSKAKAIAPWLIGTLAVAGTGYLLYHCYAKQNKEEGAQKEKTSSPSLPANQTQPQSENKTTSSTDTKQRFERLSQQSWNTPRALLLGPPTLRKKHDLKLGRTSQISKT